VTSEPGLPSEILGYYERGGERDRLTAGAGLIEFLRTQAVLRRALPPPPATVLDVGGAAGVHASWLAREGHAVRLFDPVPLHVAQAREAAAAQPEHGVLAASAIGRFGDWLFGLQAELLDDPAFREMASLSARTGQHRSVDGQWFTTAYFHRPEELRDECLQAGFGAVELVAVEGLGWLLGDRHERLAHPRRRELLLKALALTESDESMLGVSAHLLALARNPSDRLAER
jgi:hypothetical protein